MTFLAWKPEHMITFLVCVNFFFFFFFCFVLGLYINKAHNRYIRRENGGGVDSCIFIQKGQAYSILNSHKKSSCRSILPVWDVWVSCASKHADERLYTERQINKHYHINFSCNLTIREGVRNSRSVSLGTQPHNRKKKKSDCPDADGLRREKQYDIPPVFSWDARCSRNPFCNTCTSSPATRSMILLVHFMNTS